MMHHINTKKLLIFSNLAYSKTPISVMLAADTPGSIIFTTIRNPLECQEISHE